MISVCIATYNGEKYLKEQIDSILKQLSKDDEIVVSDDGSTDRTLEIIKEYNDSRIIVLSHKKNPAWKGRTASSFLFASDNFENAINHSKGDIIFLSDQDDIWYKNRVSTTVPLLNTYPMVMCNFSTIDGNNKIITEKQREKDPVSSIFVKNLMRPPFLGCCMALRREALELAMPFPSPCVGHDFWIGCLLIHLGVPYKFIDTPLHQYRIHGNNVSPTVGKSPNGLMFKITYRVRFVIQIITRSIKIRFTNKKITQ